MIKNCDLTFSFCFLVNHVFIKLHFLNWHNWRVLRGSVARACFQFFSFPDFVIFLVCMLSSPFSSYFSFLCLHPRLLHKDKFWIPHSSSQSFLSPPALSTSQMSATATLHTASYSLTWSIKACCSDIYLYQYQYLSNILSNVNGYRRILQ